jgi:hypothetical protein
VEKKQKKRGERKKRYERKTREITREFRVEFGQTEGLELVAHAGEEIVGAGVVVSGYVVLQCLFNLRRLLRIPG